MRRPEAALGALLVAPAVLVLAAVTLFPVVRVVMLSLERRVPVFGIDEFVGLAHYRFLATDPTFWHTVGVTLVFTIFSVALELALGVGAGMALHRVKRWRALTLGLTLLPWCLPGVVTARIWEWLYQPGVGLLSRLFGGVNWLGDPATALPALIVADVWRTMPFVALLVLARLGTIPPALYEAAAVDGAGRAAVFRSVTLPLLAPVMLVAALFRTLDALRAFDLVFVLTGGGPAGTTETLTVHAYRNLFGTLQLGFGSAVAVVVFALVGACAWGYLGAVERREAAS